MTNMLPSITRGVLALALLASAALPAAAQSEIVLHTKNASRIAGDWQQVADTTAAGGSRISNPERGREKVTSPLAAPVDYFELTFTAEAGRPYRFWFRGKAQNDAWQNDSVFVQFSGSVTSTGSATNRIGTASATWAGVEACSGCGLSAWGWEDNAYGGNAAPIYFATTGPQTIRIQRREDGVSIDQIVLSSSTYRTYSPGLTKNDTKILASTTTTTTTAPAPAPAPSPTGAVRVRVLQWNLHHGVGTDGVYDINRIGRWIITMKPDVVLLNEVEKYTSYGNEDQPARFKAMLESATGVRWYSLFIQEWGAFTSNGKGHQILAKWPLESTDMTTISYSRTVGRAKITVNGRPINLFVTHTDPYDQTRRLVQAREILAWSSSFSENRILGGDLNAWPDQQSILEYYKTYNDGWVTAQYMGTAYAPADISPYGATRKGRIDYILYSKGASALAVVSSKVYDTRDSNGYMPSDHRPVLTAFDVR